MKRNFVQKPRCSHKIGNNKKVRELNEIFYFILKERYLISKKPKLRFIKINLGTFFDGQSHFVQCYVK
jgi:hypothetical protein